MAESADQKPALRRAEASGVLSHVLLVRAGGWICALPITDVVETMRGLPLRPVAGAPRFIRGLSIIRGALLPVVSLAALLGAEEEASPRVGRLVTVRTGERQIALHVDEVIGAKYIDTSTLALTPPLLSEALPGPTERLGALDGQTLAMLSAARILSDDLFRSLIAQGAG
jgi:purine-binding chemotaxis protein CheW